MSRRGTIATNPFLKDNFPYDSDNDAYHCPEGKELVLTSTYYQTHKRTGYRSQLKEYTCTDCSGCPFYDQCCKSTKGRNRTIQVNEKLERVPATGTTEPANGSWEAITQAKKYRNRELLWRYKTQYGLPPLPSAGTKESKHRVYPDCMAHNLRKLHLKVQKAAA